MKTTIDLPDPLLAQVKSLADHEQRELGELMVELVRTGLERRSRRERRPSSRGHAPVEQQTNAEQWVVEWLALADELMQDAPAGPSARALLEEERNRLERR